jgi:hypothetical protein
LGASILAETSLTALSTFGTALLAFLVALLAAMTVIVCHKDLFGRKCKKRVPQKKHWTRQYSYQCRLL